MKSLKILITTLTILTSGCSSFKSEHLITINHNIKVTVAPETTGLFANLMLPTNTKIKESNATKTFQTIENTKRPTH